MVTFLSLILLAVCCGLAIFVYGPYMIEFVHDKIDEWAEVIGDFKEEE
jgi:hypothetical protein